MDARRQAAISKAAFDRRQRLRRVAVRDPSGHCVAPSSAAIRSGAYSLTHSLVLVAAKATAGQGSVKQTAATLHRTRPQVRTLVVGASG